MKVEIKVAEFFHNETVIIPPKKGHYIVITKRHKTDTRGIIHYYYKPIKKAGS